MMADSEFDLKRNSMKHKKSDRTSSDSLILCIPLMSSAGGRQYYCDLDCRNLTLLFTYFAVNSEL